MIKKIKNKLLKTATSKRGDSYFDVVIFILISTMVLVFTINVFSFMTINQKMNYMATEILKTAATYGKYSGSEIEERKKLLKEETGLDVGFEIKPQNWETSSVLRLNELIYVTAHYRTKLQGFGVASVPIYLKVAKSGLSEVYRK